MVVEKGEVGLVLDGTGVTEGEEVERAGDKGSG